jgi:hypothetical protein
MRHENRFTLDGLSFWHFLLTWNMYMLWYLWTGGDSGMGDIFRDQVKSSFVCAILLEQVRNCIE